MVSIDYSFIVGKDGCKPMPTFLHKIQQLKSNQNSFPPSEYQIESVCSAGAQQ